MRVFHVLKAFPFLQVYYNQDLRVGGTIFCALAKDNKGTFKTEQFPYELKRNWFLHPGNALRVAMGNKDFQKNEKI